MDKQCVVPLPIQRHSEYRRVVRRISKPLEQSVRGAILLDGSVLGTKRAPADSDNRAKRPAEPDEHGDSDEDSNCNEHSDSHSWSAGHSRACALGTNGVTGAGLDARVVYGELQLDSGNGCDPVLALGLDRLR